MLETKGLTSTSPLMSEPRSSATGSLETWPPGEHVYDLVYAATAWHWVDPVVRYQRAHEVLRPGDALYLPRGYLHSATALGDISAHLTVGVHPVTRWTAVESVLDQVRTLAATEQQEWGTVIGRAIVERSGVITRLISGPNFSCR